MKKQELRQNKRRNTKTNKQGLFSGLIFCADCRSKLHMHIIIVLLRLMVVYPFPQDLLSTRLALMFAVYAPFTGMSTLFLHIYAGTIQF